MTSEPAGATTERWIGSAVPAETGIIDGEGEDGLPPPDTKRWVMRRKAQIVEGVRNGVISLEEACRRYNLTIEEFLSWQRLIERHGMRGLRTTRLQEYRRGERI